MTYKQIEASREVRLWIGQIIVPGMLLGATILANPDARKWVVEKGEKVKNKIFKK